MTRITVVGPNLSIDDKQSLNSRLKYSLTGENTGNLIFCNAIRKILSHPSNEIHSMQYHLDPKEIRKKSDLLVIACANQIGSHIDMGGMANLIHDCGVPVLAIGLGTQSLAGEIKPTEIPRGSIDWLMTIKRHSPSSYPNIFTRGNFSSTIIRNLLSHDVWTGCCPSLFISTELSLGSTIKQRIDHGSRQLAVAAGHTGWQFLKPLEQKFIELITSQNSRGAYIAQSDKNLVLACDGNFRELCDVDKRMVSDFLFGSRSAVTPEEWFARNGRVFFDANDWIDHLEKFDLVIGTRFHGIAVAYQAGIPGIVITHDERLRELAETSGLLSAVDNETTDNFENAWVESKLAEFDPNAFDRNRQVMARSLCAFLYAHDVKFAGYLGDLAGIQNDS